MSVVRAGLSQIRDVEIKINIFERELYRVQQFPRLSEPRVFIYIFANMVS